MLYRCYLRNPSVRIREFPTIDTSKAEEKEEEKAREEEEEVREGEKKEEEVGEKAKEDCIVRNDLLNLPNPHM